jgi:hypothetical protein
LSFVLGHMVNLAWDLFLIRDRKEKIWKKGQGRSDYLFQETSPLMSLTWLVGFSYLGSLAHGMTPRPEWGVEPPTTRLLRLRLTLPSQLQQWWRSTGRAVSTYSLPLRFGAALAAGFVFCFFKKFFFFGFICLFSLCFCCFFIFYF